MDTIWPVIIIMVLMAVLPEMLRKKRRYPTRGKKGPIPIPERRDKGKTVHGPIITPKNRQPRQEQPSQTAPASTPKQPVPQSSRQRPQPVPPKPVKTAPPAQRTVPAPPGIQKACTGTRRDAGCAAFGPSGSLERS
jgi:hypothetical protein